MLGVETIFSLEYNSEHCLWLVISLSERDLKRSWLRKGS